MTHTEIQEARKLAGLSRMEFARTIGVSLHTVYLWEGGGARPNPSHERRIRDLAADETAKK